MCRQSVEKHESCTKWLPKILNENHKVVRGEISQRLLDRFAAEGYMSLMS